MAEPNLPVRSLVSSGALLPPAAGLGSLMYPSVRPLPGLSREPHPGEGLAQALQLRRWPWPGGDGLACEAALRPLSVTPVRGRILLLVEKNPHAENSCV